MDPFNPSDQKVGMVIGGLILLGAICGVWAEIEGHVRRRREMKRFRARLRWLHTPEAFRGPEPR